MIPKERRKKILVRIGIALIGISLVFYISSIFYIRSHKNEVAAKILQAINERFRGDITFGEVSVEKWEGLPAPGISFNDLTVIDTTDNYSFVLHAKKAEILLSITDLLKQKIHLRSVLFSDGDITVHNYTPLSAEERAELPPKIDSMRLKLKRKKYYFEKDTEVNLNNFDVKIRHHTKNKLFDFHVNEINSVLDFDGNIVSAETEMDVVVNSLAFNLAKGSYINGARVAGTYSSVYDLDLDQWQIDPFRMDIDEQVFDFKGEFDFRGWGSMDLQFENKKTDFEASIGLLKDSIRIKLEKFEFENPLYTNTRIRGNLVYRGNPRVEVDFKTEDNPLVLDERLPVQVNQLSGIVINRIYDDERADSEDLRNIRVKFDAIEAKINDLTIKVVEPLFTGTPEVKNFWRGKLLVDGPMESLNGFIEDQILNFDDGNFKITADIEGDIKNLEDFVANSQGKLEMINSRITNKINKFTIPIDQMVLSVEENQAHLQRFEVSLNARDKIQIQGEVRNFSDLFSESQEKSLSSNFHMTSKNLLWKDFLKLFSIGKTGTDDKNQEIVLQKALKGLYRNYNPAFSVNVDQLQIGSLQLKNFTTGLRFENENLLNLDRTRFDFGEGDMRIDADFDLREDESIRMTAELEGKTNTEVLNDILGVDKLDFNGGNIQVDAKIQGNLLQINRILKSSVLNMKIDGTEVTYIPSNAVLPIRTVDLTLDGDDAIINNLSLAIGTDTDLNFTGTLENLPTLLFKDETEKVRSEFTISSDKFAWEDMMSLVGRQEDKMSETSAEEASQKLKKLLKDIQNAIDPKINVRIKELNYAGMPSLIDFNSGIYFQDENTLVFEETAFDYEDSGKVSLRAILDTKDETEIGVRMNLTAAGNPDQLNAVLNNDVFLFESGEYEAEAYIEGAISHLDSLIATSESTLMIRNGTILHKPSQSRIPFSKLEVDMADNNANLKEFTIVLGSADMITFTGRVEHISDLIFDVPYTESKAASYVEATSERLTFDDILELFEYRQVSSTGNQQQQSEDNAIKPAIRDVYYKFKPRLSASIREFQLYDLVLKDLHTGFFFENENLLYLEDTGFRFYDGKVNLDAHLDITDPNNTLFAFGFSTEELELDKVLESFDYFNIDSFKEAENIRGKVSLNTAFEGDIIDSTGIDSSSLKGNIEFKVEDAQVKGFEPIIKVANKVFKKQRFEDIRFSTIENTFYLADNLVDIPLMEIQSTALNIFLSGQLGLGEVDTNIWAAVPLQNFKKRDLVNIPDKKGYIEAGKMVYIEAKSDKNHEIKYVLHLSPRKYYKERGMLSDYRQEIKEERKLRREFKRASRNAEPSDSGDKPD